MDYEKAAKVLNGVLQRKGSVRSLSFSEKGADVKKQKAIFALVSNAVKHMRVLNRAADFAAKQLGEGAKMAPQRRAVVVLMCYDVIYSKNKRVLGNHAMAGRINGMTATIREAVREYVDKEVEMDAAMAESGPLPGLDCFFVRVNTLKVSVDEAVELLRGMGLFETVVPDDLLPGCLVRLENPVGGNLEKAVSELKKSELFAERKLIIQSKPSCMPPVALNPPKGARVFDCCSAPGNKTSLLAQIMENTGQIYAFDRDQERLNTMRRLLDQNGVENVETICADFLTISPEDPKFRNIEYILLDPSCSGSGLLDRPDTDRLPLFDEKSGAKADKRTFLSARQAQRVRTLSHFQLQILRHAMSFGAKKIVYSTCSVHKDENEEVVWRALEGSNYRLVECLPDWHRRGDNSVFEGADKCVRVDPNQDKITGFFVSCFERIDDAEPAATEETPELAEPKKKKRKTGRKK